MQQLAVDEDDLAVQADALADDVVACAPEALRKIKRRLRASLELVVGQQDALFSELG